MPPDLAFTALAALTAAAAARAADFADTVVSYLPAPGQFINNPVFNDPSRALGPPIGGGTLVQENSKLVSLGGLGGSITLRFNPPVLDDPRNPYGLDAIVFGNALWAGANPNRRFFEAGVIEVSRDDNANSLPDDVWYVIRGSHLPALPADAYQSQAWDNNPSTPSPPVNTAWYPAPPAFPAWPTSYITATYRLPALFEQIIFVNPNGTTSTAEGAWGYADCSPTLILGDTDADNTADNPSLAPAEFYTVPDNPFAVGISPGSGGGDAFDIAWAVHPVTGQPAHLDRFDFIRISTAVLRVDAALGELSTEIGAVSRVRANPDFFDLTSDQRADAEDLYAWHAPSPTRRDFTGEGAIDTDDGAMLVRCIRADEPSHLGASR